MKKVVFGIFAHPDDEAFGPAGALLMEKAAGAEIHLICATAGESGMNPDNHPNLAEVRLAEWQTAGQLIGADSMHHLGYKDGTLCNNNYMEIAERIDDIIRNIIKGRRDITIEFLSSDLNGITGHIDHIVIARIAAYVYCTMKQADKRVGKMRLACITHDEVPTSNCHWLYMEAGRTDKEIAETVDASEHLGTIKAIMHAHHTQRIDCETHLRRRGDSVAINHFLVLD